MRLENAQKSYEVAELAAAEQEIPASRSVAAALAVLSGIAAVDAACCAALGRRSRGEDHREAAALLRQIVPAGNRAAKAQLRGISESIVPIASKSSVPVRSGSCTESASRMP
jgi:hypothetical protein